MELAETIESLNRQLIDEFGLDSDTGRAIFRIVWSDNQYETRLVNHTESGIELLYPEVRTVRKYAYIHALYVLERLVLVPDVNKSELPSQKLSYEPIWAYCDSDHNYIPPIWGATKFIIDTLYAAMGKKSLRKYVESEKDSTPEGREERISELQEELFGNETETSDALRYKEGIVVPNNMKEN